MIQLHQGDCLEKLKELQDSSIDSIVTDPPYGLSFMGKKWDYDAPSVDIWLECLRVLKPGGHLLSFAGSRTYHRMAVNIEDAGFEIRDQIMWVYGSGFPKSHNIGVAVDKLQGNERKRVDNPYAGRNPNSKNKGENLYGKDLRNDDTLVFTKGNSPWEGWGTGLKPAHEPIVVARKPISEKNIAENVLKWGTGGINIDSSRIEGVKRTPSYKELGDYSVQSEWHTRYKSKRREVDITQGRFPANFIHDGSNEVVSLFPDTVSKWGLNKKKKEKKDGFLGFTANSYLDENFIGDKGSASRFFYCAKASKSERNEGLEGFEHKKTNDGRDKEIDNAFQRGSTLRKNNHPTVKPLKLMSYLVRLVTPPNGTCLDPFMGSGSTGIACKKEGFNFIGIEREAEYLEIAKARIDNAKTD